MKSSMHVFLMIAFLTVSWLAAPNAMADTFKVSAPKTWQKINRDPEGAIYENTRSSNNERVIIQSFSVASDEAELHANLEGKGEALTEARTPLFRQYGIGSYNVIDIEKRKAPKSKFEFFQRVHSRYRDMAWNEVQMVERQYVKGSTMYVVTYLVDAVALNDRQKVETVLDFFEPIHDPSRATAASEATKAETAGVKDNGERPDATLAPTPVQDLNMSDSETQKMCKDVPEERRRTSNDRSFMRYAASPLTMGKNCFLGAAENLWGMVKGAWDVAIGAGRYVINKGFRAQVNSTIGVIASEAMKNPVDFGKRVAAEVYAAAKASLGSWFQCLKTEEQIKGICSMVSNLIPLGLLVKILTKAPMAANEVAKVAQLAREALGGPKDVGIAKVIATADTKPGTSGGGGGGSTKPASNAKAETGAAGKSGTADKSGSVQRTNQPDVNLKNAYGDLLKDVGNEEEILAFIGTLEKNGQSRSKIRAALAKAKRQCSLK